MRKISWLLALAIPATIISCQKEAVSKTETTSRDGEVVIAGNSNDEKLYGQHYNLNIIGMEKGKSIDSAQGNGHRIFVQLGAAGQPAKTTKILLREGSDFAVLDPNGTDGSAAFQLPAPDPDSTGTTAYSVFVRALGKPGGHVSMYSCGVDEVGTEYCSTSMTVEMDPHGANNKFSNVSKQLLYVWANIDDDADLEITPLFDDELVEYYWKYDNQGVRLSQMRFYPGIKTTVWTSN